MPSAICVDRRHKQQTDRSLSQAYSRLAQDWCAHASFAGLLQHVRRRAPALLAAPVNDARHPGIDALVNLARFSHAWVRRPVDWSASDAAWQMAVHSLAQHLIGKYPVPPFLSAAWSAGDDAASDVQRGWFVAHGAGVRFRSLDLPIVMTRRMEQIFLGSPDHLEIACAMRRAELLGLGADVELTRAVLATRQARDLDHGDFWRTVWVFLIVNRGEIDPAQVGPLVDFLQAIRHERTAIETAHGPAMQEPPQPSFSMKGRTARSLLRLMEGWHRGLGVAIGGLTWTPSPLRPMAIEEPAEDPAAPPTVWRFLELTSAEQLHQEGVALRHCVASYADRCRRGTSRIWSLRAQRGDRVRSVLTIEVDPKRRAVVQARGWGNRPARGTPLRLLQTWATRERLQLFV